MEAQYLNVEITEGADTCIVHFSARNKPKGKFDRYLIYQGASNIYLNSAAKDWYLNGLPCWGGEFDASVVRLQELVKLSGAKKVVCIGSSMGAFGAALFASHLNADLICFAPELYLNIYSGFSHSDKLTGALPRLEQKGNPRRAMILAGANSPSDVVCAKYFQKHWPDCQSYVLQSCGHGTARHLKNHGILENVIREFVLGHDVAAILAPLVVPRDFFSGVNFVEPGSFSVEHLNAYTESIYRKIKLHDVMEICGHLRARGAFSAALTLVERAMADHGPIADLVLLKARCLRRLRRDQEAIDAFTMLELHPEYKKQAYLGKSLVYKKLGELKNLHESYSHLVDDLKKDLDVYLPLLNECANEIQMSISSGVGRHDGEVDLTKFASESGSSSILEVKKLEEIDYVNLIEKHLTELEFDKATSCAVEGTRDYPKSVAIHSQYALIAQKQKNWTMAVSRLLTLLSLEGEKKSPETYSRLVQAFRNAKQFPDAELIANEGLGLFPTSSILQSEYAWTAQTLKDWPEAVSRLEKLVAMLGENAKGKVLLRLADSRRNLEQVSDSRSVQREVFLEQEINFSSKKSPEPALIKNLLLTTFPGHKSQNVGDNLIANSAIALVKARNRHFEPVTEFREKNLDPYPDGGLQTIIAPGFSVSDGVYPKLFGLYSNLERLKNFFPVGCSFQHVIPSHATFESYQYGTETQKFLRLIASRSGALPCRDQLIVKLLHRYDIPAVYSGDLAIYDEDKLNTPFMPPAAINSVVFTIQHHDRYDAQSFKLLELIKERFPESKLYVAFHSKVGPKPQKIANHAVSLGFTELHLYGDVSNLEVYDSMDLHIGYRLHGHISFLRRRKPSILLVEDARSFGLAHTPGTDVGCFEALSLETMEADMLAPDMAMNFVEEQIQCNFQDYQRVFRFIDKTYNEFVRPYFDDLAAKTV